MTLNYEETKVLIDRVLEARKENVSQVLDDGLGQLSRSMPEFYDGIIKHGPGMTYTSDQWLDFHLKVPHWRLRDDRTLMDKLSPKQRERLEWDDTINKLV